MFVKEEDKAGQARVLNQAGMHASPQPRQALPSVNAAACIPDASEVARLFQEATCRAVRVGAQL